MDKSSCEGVSLYCDTPFFKKGLVKTNVISLY